MDESQPSKKTDFLKIESLVDGSYKKRGSLNQIWEISEADIENLGTHFTQFLNIRFDELVLEVLTIRFIGSITKYQFFFVFNFCSIDNIRVTGLQVEDANFRFNCCKLSGHFQNFPKLKLKLFNCFSARDIIEFSDVASISIYYSLLNGADDFYRWYKVSRNNEEQFLSSMPFNTNYNINNVVEFDCNMTQYELEKPIPPSANNTEQSVLNEKVGFFDALMLHLKKMSISIIAIQNNSERRCNIFLTQVKLKRCFFRGKFDGDIKLYGLRIDEFVMSNFSVSNECVIFGLQPSSPDDSDSRLSFVFSNLDNIWFDNVNFSKYDTVLFDTTRLGKVKFSSCYMPKKLSDYSRFKTSIFSEDDYKEKYNQRRYDTFLELKNVFLASGNKYEAYKLDAVSKEALLRSESLTGQDKLIFWLNRLSNNHGLSIVRPFTWYFVIGLIGYVFFLLSIERCFLVIPVDYGLGGHYFSFIDLTSKSNFLGDKIEVGSFGIFWFWLFKLLLVYLAYQFVSAFRRFGKQE